MNLRERLSETFRAIDRFRRLIFGSPVPRDEAIRWVHQQLEQACEPVHPLKSVMAEWERHLAHNRVTAYSDMAGPHRCTVEKIVENQRPKPSWVYRPLLIPRPDKQPPALCDFVLILCVLHDGIGYPESPLKPERPVNEMLNWRWRDCWEQGFDEQPCPLPEDPAKDWHPKPLLRDHLEPRIGDWFRQVDAAFRQNFGLPAEPQGAGEDQSSGDRDSESAPDGPFGIDEFRWKGRVVSLIGGIPFAYLKAIWSRRNRTLERDDISEVHGDRNDPPEWKAVQRNFGRMNQKMEEWELPFRFTGESRSFCVVLKHDPE